MITTLRRTLTTGGAAIALAVATMAGSAAATTEPPPPTSEAIADSSAATDELAAQTPECADTVALLDAQFELFDAFFAEDGAAVEAVFESLAELAPAAQESAPPEISESVTLWVAPLADIEELFAGVDMTDFEAVIAVLETIPEDEASNEAAVAVEEWATENCGWSASFDDPFADAPEPPECDVLDVEAAGAAAAAAGVDVDVTDSDGGADVSLPGFWTKSCSYGNGALTLSTISFNDMAEVAASYVDTAIDNGGAVLDVEVGSLPESTIVTEVDGFVTVAVLDAPIPFSVGLGIDADPAVVVTVAEAVLMAQPAEGAAPATNDVGTPAPDGSAAPPTTEG